MAKWRTDKEILESQRAAWKADKELQQAIQAYLKRHNLTIDPDFVCKTGIDCVFVCVDDKRVLVVGLPPVSNYEIDETEYTDMYLRVEERELIAV
jgi:hypothetical protein